MIKDNFCVLPFIQTVVRTNGLLSPCCEMIGTDNIRNVSIQQYWNSDGMKQLRDQMLNQNNEISVCNTCYKQEEIAGKSLRTESLSEASHVFLNKKYHKQTLEYYNYNDLDFPKRLEMHLGNICNLKCLTCRPEDSSMFLSENRILKISNHSQQDYQLDDNLIQHNLQTALDQGVERLDLRGGESMLMPGIKKILSDLDKDQCNITLRIQTNATILDHEWKLILNKFLHVELMISVDAYADANTYIRYPSEWQDIERNIEYFQSLPNTELYINCTVSNLNFLILPDLIDWAKQKNLYFHYANLIDPDIYQYTNMPTELFELAKQRLKTYPEVLDLLNNQSNPVLWSEFCQMIDQRDAHRKNRIFDVVPEFKQYWTSL
jgi:MoaA/NifB/PqqE/SkfB family radical SAM enzyme